MAEKVDGLCIAAQAESSDYVSFSSFLGIESQPESQAKGDQVNQAVTPVGEEEEKRGPLSTAGVAGALSRQRPVKEEEAKRFCRKDLEASIKSLLG